MLKENDKVFIKDEEVLELFPFLKGKVFNVDAVITSPYNKVAISNEYFKGKFAVEDVELVQKKEEVKKVTLSKNDLLKAIDKVCSKENLKELGVKDFDNLDFLMIDLIGKLIGVSLTKELFK